MRPAGRLTHCPRRGARNAWTRGGCRRAVWQDNTVTPPPRFNCRATPLLLAGGILPDLAEERKGVVKESCIPVHEVLT
jgi:hypothetical protein